MAAPQSNSDDIQRMQQEAVRRVREMQARAQHFSSEHGPQSREFSQPEGPRDPQEQNQAADSLSEPAAPGAAIFDSLTRDSDRTLILMLILLLMGDDADLELLFALLYLLI